MAVVARAARTTTFEAMARPPAATISAAAMIAIAATVATATAVGPLETSARIVAYASGVAMREFLARLTCGMRSTRFTREQERIVLVRALRRGLRPNGFHGLVRFFGRTGL